jgi:hypothetical protein
MGGSQDRLRAQVLLQLRAEGMGEAEKISQELSRAQKAASALKGEFVAGVKSGEDYRREIRVLASDLKFWQSAADALVKTQKELTATAGASISSSRSWTAAVKEGTAAAQAYNQVLSEEAALQARLGEMEERTAKETAQALMLQSESTKEAIAQYNALEVAQSKAAANLAAEQSAAAMLARQKAAALDQELDMQEALRQMEARSGREAAEAAMLRGQSTKESIAQYRELEARHKAEAQSLLEERTAAASLANQKRESLAADAAAASMLARQKSAAYDAVMSKIEQLTRMEAISTSEINREQAHMNALLEEGANAVRTEAAAVDRSAREYKVRNYEVEKAYGTTTRFVEAVERSNNRLQQGRTYAADFSYGLLNISHAAQDAQYGVGAVLNNIPLITTSVTKMIPALDRWTAKIGGPEGLAGGIMIAAVAANTLYNNWDKVMEYAGIGIAPPILDSTEHLAKNLNKNTAELEKLGSQARLTLVQLERFRKLQQDIERDQEEKERREETKRLNEIKGDKQQAAAQGFKAAIAAAGGGEAAEAQLIQALINAGDQLGQQYTIQGVTAQAQQMMRDAAGGSTGARDEITKAINRFMPEGGRDFAREIELKSPERLAKVGEEERIGRELDASNKKAKADREENEREAKAEKAVLASKFNQRDALAGVLEPVVEALVAGGQTDPAALKAAIKAQTEEAMRRSRIVPENMIADVGALVADHAVVEVMTGLGAQGGDIVAVARANAAAAKAKAEGKAEKPEIARDVINIGAQIKPGLESAVARRMGAGQTDAQIRQAMFGQVVAEAGNLGSGPEVVDAVADKILNNVVDRVRAQVGQGPDRAANARNVIAGHQQKLAAQAKAGQRREAADELAQVANVVQQEAPGRMGMQIGGDLARRIAHNAIQLNEAGTNANEAIIEAMQEALRTMQGQAARMQHQGNHAAMMGNQFRQMRTQRAMPMNTIPFQR